MLDKGCTAIKGALKELDAAGLLERETAGLLRTPSALCESAACPQWYGFSDQTDGRKSDPHLQSEKRPYDGRKTDPMMVGKRDP